MNWPKRIIDEYKAFDGNQETRYAGDLVRLLFDTSMPPCFFAGDINHARFGLLGLNPGLAKGRTQELKAYKSKGWEDLYLNFFTVFRKELGINSNYYTRFAMLLSGVLGESIDISVDERYELLQENLVNFDLIPYHSKNFKIGKIEDEKMDIIRPYTDVTKSLVQNSSVEYLFINGKPWKTLLFSKDNMLDYYENEIMPLKMRKMPRFSLHFGECMGKPAVWFDRFVTSIRGIRNQDLYDIGKTLRRRWRIKKPP